MNPEFEIQEMNTMLKSMDEDLKTLKNELEAILAKYAKVSKFKDRFVSKVHKPKKLDSYAT